MTASITLPRGARIAHVPGSFVLESGDVLEHVVVGFELTGPEAGPLLVVQGGISAGRHVHASDRLPAPGWWDACAGPNAPIDTERYRVLSLDPLGGVGLTTNPTNIAAPAQRGLGFPVVSSHDQARLTLYLLDLLDVPRVHAFVGASYGAMVGLACGELAPERFGRIVAISGAHEPWPMATAWRSLQRRIVRLGLEHGCADEALAIARGLGMTSYRSAEEFATRFGERQPGCAADASPGLDEQLIDVREDHRQGRSEQNPATRFGERHRERVDARPEARGADDSAVHSGAAAPRRLGAVRAPVEAWLEAHGESFVRRFEAAALYVLSRAIDRHRVIPERIACPVHVIGAHSDQLVPPAQLIELERRLAGPCRLSLLDSPFGHDAFLKEPAALGALLRESLAEVQR